MSLRRNLLSLSVLAALAAAPLAQAEEFEHGRYDHVLLLSVDGLHAVDAEHYIASKPASNLAKLAAHGVRFTNASSSRPSDSFPGVLALVTGGSPAAHGVFYDVSWDRSQYDPAGAGCTGTPGIQTTYDESIDTVDASGISLDAIDPTLLPWGIKNGQCVRIYPHDFVQVNTVFEVAKAAHKRTAWADKHPAYDLVNGPSGKGVDDLYTPEITSPAFDATQGVVCTSVNDEKKVAAILNEIKGLDHAGKKRVGTPAIFGMNFQAVSVGQKVTHSKTPAKGSGPDFCNRADAALDAAATALQGKSGGYVAETLVPTEVLQYSLDYVDGALGRMVGALRQQGKLDSTMIILSAKHGQSPIDPQQAKKVGGLQGNIAALAVDASDVGIQQALVAAGENEDSVALIWLQDQTQAAAAAVFLRKYSAPGFPGGLAIQSVLAGESLTLKFRDPMGDNTTPDLIVLPPAGTIYTGSSKKNAEHGGFSADDTSVALIVASPRLHGAVVKSPVETAQVAPTILEALGLPAGELKAVQLEKTTALPAVQ